MENLHTFSLRKTKNKEFALSGKNENKKSSF